MKPMATRKIDTDGLARFAFTLNPSVPSYERREEMPVEKFENGKLKLIDCDAANSKELFEEA